MIMSTTLYLKCEKNNEVSKKHVCLGDVSTIWCTDKAITSKVKTIKLLNIQEDKHKRYAFSVMKIIEFINQDYPNVDIQTLIQASITAPILTGIDSLLRNYFKEQTQQQQDEPYITRQEAANILGVSLVTIWQLTRANKIPYYRVGKRLLFRKSELQKSFKVK